MKPNSSDLASHLKANAAHLSTWQIISAAPHITIKRKILEALHIAKFRPKLNDQVKSSKLKLFPYGIT